MKWWLNINRFSELDLQAMGEWPVGVQWIASIFLSTGLLILGWTLLVLPENQKIEKIESEIRTLTEIIQNVDPEHLAILKQEPSTIRIQSSQIETLTILCEEHRVVLRSLKQNPLFSEQGFLIDSATLSIEGSFDSVQNFLDSTVKKTQGVIHSLQITSNSSIIKAIVVIRWYGLKETS